MKRRLLLVEDDEMLRRALPRLLARLGYDVHVAASNAEVSDDIGSFEVGIFDINLPDGDGVSLARRLLYSQTVAHAIFYTGSLELDRVDDAAMLGTIVTKMDGIAGLRHALSLTPAAPSPSASPVLAQRAAPGRGEVSAVRSIESTGAVGAADSGSER